MADKKISALTGATTPLAGTEVLPIVQSGATVKVAVSDLTAGRAVATGPLTATGAISSSSTFNFSSANTANAILTPDTGTGTGSVYIQAGAGSSAYGGAFRMFGNSHASYPGDAIAHPSGTGKFRVNTLLNGGGTDYLSCSSTGTTVTGTITPTDNFVQGTAAKGINFTANTPAAGMTSQLLNWYEEGTFTATIATGLTTTPTGSVSYVRIGSQVTLQFPSSISGQSNATGMTITGLPSVLWPTGTRYMSGTVSTPVNAAGLILLSSSGVFTVYATLDGGSFATSGGKGIYGFSVSYLLNA